MTTSVYSQDELDLLLINYCVGEQCIDRNLKELYFLGP